MDHDESTRKFERLMLKWPTTRRTRQTNLRLWFCSCLRNPDRSPSCRQRQVTNMPRNFRELAQTFAHTHVRRASSFLSDSRLTLLLHS
jgi:hypothetical protein